MREEVTEKERDEHFNNIRSVIRMKQECMVKGKANTPIPTTSNNDMDLLDDDEASLIKDGSPPLTSMESTWCSLYRPSLGTPRRWSLRCVSALRRPCSRSPRSQASTCSRCTFRVTSMGSPSPGCSLITVLSSI
jgi:hypothetical protein